MLASEKEPSWREIIKAVSLFIFGFLLVASLLHIAIRDPLYLHADMRSEKLVMLKRLKSQVSSAVFGSSHVHNGFDPRAFDRVLAGSPAQTRTVNLAIMGGSQSEQRSMALEFLRNLQAPPDNTACLVILELNAGANFQNAHLVHPRSINIYDWPTVRFISRLKNTDMGFTQQAGRIGFAFIAGILHYANVGMLSDKIIAPPVDAAMMEHDTEEDRRGEDVLAYDPQTGAEESKMMAQEQGQFKLNAPEMYPGNYELIDELAASSPVSNVSFVYFVYPKLTDVSGTFNYPSEIVTPRGHTVPIIDLARPDRFPSFYQTKFWHDEAHLDEQGAARVSEVFAQQLMAWYTAHGAPQRCGG
ncbi:hypothetical protein [Tunturiibacter lichenicola]|uniref:hypothetical protein n=1 Tax=Tunturiibacter lichenicola TaxID=2051959 RepID=UPI003D9BDD8A